MRNTIDASRSRSLGRSGRFLDHGYLCGFVYFKSDGIFKSDSQSRPTARKVQTSVLYSLTRSSVGSKKTRGKRPVRLPPFGQKSRSFFEARGRRMKAEPPNAAGLRSKSCPLFNTRRKIPEYVRGVYVSTRRPAKPRHFSVAAHSPPPGADTRDTRVLLLLFPSSSSRRPEENSQLFWNSFEALASYRSGPAPTSPPPLWPPQISFDFVGKLPVDRPRPCRSIAVLAARDHARSSGRSACQLARTSPTLLPRSRFPTSTAAGHLKGAQPSDLIFVNGTVEEVTHSKEVEV